MCQWMANYNWKEYAAQLDPLLDVFLDSATAEERRQIEHAKHLGVSSRDLLGGTSTYVCLYRR